MIKDSYLNKVKYMLKQSGYRNSCKREYILKVLLKSTLYICAQEIKNKIYKDFNIKISLATVYNQLELLESFSIVKSLILPKKRKKVYVINRIF